MCAGNLMVLVLFLPGRERHLYDRGAEEILQRHEETGLQETSETHSQAYGRTCSLQQQLATSYYVSVNFLPTSY